MCVCVYMVLFVCSPDAGIERYCLFDYRANGQRLFNLKNRLTSFLQKVLIGIEMPNNIL